MSEFLHSGTFGTIQSENMVILLENLSGRDMRHDLQVLVSYVSILFEFEQSVGAANSGAACGNFRFQIREWISGCVAVMLRCSSSMEQQCLMHHLVRTPEIGHWGAAFIQFPPYWTNAVASHMITMLSILLSPIPSAEVVSGARSGSVSNISGELQESIDGFLLEEEDYVLLLEQFPFEQMFLFIFDPAAHGKGGVLFETTDYLIRLLSAALELFAPYKQLVQLLGNILKTCITQATNYVQEFGSNASAAWNLQLVALMLDATQALLASKVSTLWQFVVSLPFDDVPAQAAWNVFLAIFHLPILALPSDLVSFHDQRGNRLNQPRGASGSLLHGAVGSVSMTFSEWKVFVGDNPDLRNQFRALVASNDGAIFLVHALEQLAVSKPTGSDLALVIAHELSHIAFLTPDTWASYHKPVRSVLASICALHPSAVTALIEWVGSHISTLGSGAKYIIAGLPLSKHIPQEAEVQLFSKWLLAPLESNESTLVRFILDSLQWGWSVDDGSKEDVCLQLFLPPEVHRSCAIAVGNAFAHHLTGNQKSGLFDIGARREREAFQAWCWTAVMRMTPSSPSGRPYLPPLERRGERLATLHKLASNPPSDFKLLALPVFLLIEYSDMGHSKERFRSHSLRLLTFLMDQKFHHIVGKLVLDTIPGLLESGLRSFHSELVVKEKTAAVSVAAAAAAAAAAGSAGSGTSSSAPAGVYKTPGETDSDSNEAESAPAENEERLAKSPYASGGTFLGAYRVLERLLKKATRKKAVGPITETLSTAIVCQVCETLLEERRYGGAVGRAPELAMNLASFWLEELFVGLPCWYTNFAALFCLDKLAEGFTTMGLSSVFLTALSEACAVAAVPVSKLMHRADTRTSYPWLAFMWCITQARDQHEAWVELAGAVASQPTVKVEKHLKKRKLGKDHFAIVSVASLALAWDNDHCLHPLVWQLLCQLACPREVLPVQRLHGSPGMQVLAINKQVDKLGTKLFAVREVKLSAQQAAPSGVLCGATLDVILAWWQGRDEPAIEASMVEAVGFHLACFSRASILQAPDASLWVSLLPGIDELVSFPPDSAAEFLPSLWLRRPSAISSPIRNAPGPQAKPREGDSVTLLLPPAVPDRLPSLRDPAMDIPGAALVIDLVPLARAAKDSVAKMETVATLNLQYLEHLCKLYTTAAVGAPALFDCPVKKKGCAGASIQRTGMKSIMAEGAATSMQENRSRADELMGKAENDIISEELCQAVLRVQQAVEELVKRFQVLGPGNAQPSHSGAMSAYDDILFKGKHTFFALLMCFTSEGSELFQFGPTAAFLSASISILGRHFATQHFDLHDTKRLLDVLSANSQCVALCMPLVHVERTPTLAVEYLDAVVNAAHELGYREVAHFLDAFDLRRWLNLPEVRRDQTEQLRRLLCWATSRMVGSTSALHGFFKDLILSITTMWPPAFLFHSIAAVVEATMRSRLELQPNGAGMGLPNAAQASQAANPGNNGSSGHGSSGASGKEKTCVMLWEVLGNALDLLQTQGQLTVPVVTQIANSLGFHFWKARRETKRSLFALLPHRSVLVCVANVLADVVGLFLEVATFSGHGLAAETTVVVANAWGAIEAMFGAWLCTVMDEDDRTVLVSWSAHEEPLVSTILQPFCTCIAELSAAEQVAGRDGGTCVLRRLWSYYAYNLLPGAREHQHRILGLHLLDLPWSDLEGVLPVLEDILRLANTSAFRSLPAAASLLRHVLLALDVNKEVELFATASNRGVECSSILSLTLQSLVIFTQEDCTEGFLFTVRQKYAPVPWFLMEEAPYLALLNGRGLTQLRNILGALAPRGAVVHQMPYADQQQQLLSSPYPTGPPPSYSQALHRQQQPGHQGQYALIAQPLAQPAGSMQAPPQGLAAVEERRQMAVHEATRVDVLFGHDLNFDEVVPMSNTGAASTGSQRLVTLLKVMSCSGLRQVTLRGGQQEPGRPSLYPEGDARVEMIRKCGRKHSEFYKTLAGLVLSYSAPQQQEVDLALRQIVRDEVTLLARATTLLLEHCSDVFDLALRSLFRFFNSPRALRFTQISMLTSRCLLSSSPAALAVVSAACNTVEDTSTLAPLVERGLAKYFLSTDGWAPVVAAVAVPEIYREQFLFHCASNGYLLTVYAHVKRLLSDAAARAPAASQRDLLVSLFRWNKLVNASMIGRAFVDKDTTAYGDLEPKLLLLWAVTIHRAEAELLLVHQSQNREAFNFIGQQLAGMAEQLLYMSGNVRKRGLFSRSQDDEDGPVPNVTKNLRVAARLVACLILFRGTISNGVRKDRTKELKLLCGHKDYGPQQTAIVHGVAVVLRQGRPSLGADLLELIGILQRGLFPTSLALKQL